MPKPKIASKTKASNKKARELGYESAFHCYNTGTSEHKQLVQDAFTNTNPRQSRSPVKMIELSL